MKLREEVVRAAAKATRGMRLVLLLSDCLFTATGFGQTKFDPTHAMSPAQMQRTAFSSEGSMPGEKSAAPKPAAKASSSTMPAKGTHEGIQVLGRWVIEVKNPDGTVTARREFENAIQGDGQSFLTGVLTGTNSTGGLAIALNRAYTRFQPLEIFPGPAGGAPASTFVPILGGPGLCGQFFYAYYATPDTSFPTNPMETAPSASCCKTVREGLIVGISPSGKNPLTICEQGDVETAGLADKHVQLSACSYVPDSNRSVGSRVH